jgi:hypothetical protein
VALARRLVEGPPQSHIRSRLLDKKADERHVALPRHDHERWVVIITRLPCAPSVSLQTDIPGAPIWTDLIGVGTVLRQDARHIHAPHLHGDAEGCVFVGTGAVWVAPGFEQVIHQIGGPLSARYEERCILKLVDPIDELRIAFHQPAHGIIVRTTHPNLLLGSQPYLFKVCAGKTPRFSSRTVAAAPMKALCLFTHTLSRKPKSISTACMHCELRKDRGGSWREKHGGSWVDGEAWGNGTRGTLRRRRLKMANE